MKAFVEERNGPEAWSKLLATMTESDRGVLSSILVEGWYGMDLHARVNRAFCDFFYDGNLAGIEELGRYSAERDITGRWLFRVVRPSFMIRNMNIFWRQDEGSGHWTTFVQGDEFVAQLSGWEGRDAVLCRRLLGYIGRMLDMAGVVERQEHVHANGKDNASCTFRFRWKPAQDLPINGSLSSTERLSALADEFTMFPDVSSLADAIVEVIHFQLSFPYVELWVRPPDSEGLRLAKYAGTKGTGIPVCSLLQRIGSTIGRIDVEGTPDSRQDLFNELIPMLALPLDSTRLSGLQVCPTKGFARRLIDARMKWNLTPREVDVLELLLRGDKYDEIGLELECAASTVEQYANRIFRKSGAKNRNMLSWMFWMKL